MLNYHLPHTSNRKECYSSSICPKDCFYISIFQTCSSYIFSFNRSPHIFHLCRSANHMDTLHLMCTLMFNNTRHCKFHLICIWMEHHSKAYRSKMLDSSFNTESKSKALCLFFILSSWCRIDWEEDQEGLNLGLIYTFKLKKVVSTLWL